MVRARPGAEFDDLLAPINRGCSSLHGGAGNYRGGTSSVWWTGLRASRTSADVWIDEFDHLAKVTIDYTGRCPIDPCVRVAHHITRRNRCQRFRARIRKPKRTVRDVDTTVMLYDPKRISEKGFAVCERDQSRWSSQRSCTQLTGRAPACMIRSIAARCASTEVPPTASTTG